MAVDRAADIEPGLYHYDAAGHALVRISGRTSAVSSLLAEARTGAGGIPETQALVIVTARFARVTWKYASIAYALILRDTGVLYQTLYLAATDLGLAPCALGAGDGALFAEASASIADRGQCGRIPSGRPPGTAAGRGPGGRGNRDHFGNRAGMKTESIFRDAALAARMRPKELDDPLWADAPHERLCRLVFAAALVVAVAWGALWPVERTVVREGVLVLVGERFPVAPVLSGTVSEGARARRRAGRRWPSDRPAGWSPKPLG